MRFGFHPTELGLRARLVVLLLVLATVGLAVADVVSYRALHDYLYDRVDQQVGAAVAPVTGELLQRLPAGTLPGGPKRTEGGGPRRPQGGRPLGGGPGGPGGPTSTLPPGTFGELRARDGEVLEEVSFGFFSSGEEAAAEPALPDELQAGSRAEPNLFTIGQRGGGGEDFRVAVGPGPGGTTVIVAVPLGDTHDTLDRLALIELVVSGAILAALALAAWWLAGLGLRPLRRMEAVAGDIAAGDLSRRVEPANERTEVGRLGLALNAMLEQIEAGFAEREASEARLRQFLADASHELRTPLASIRGYSELYRIGAASEPADVERAMGRIEAESTRMAGLVDDLLALARIDEVRAPNRAPVDLRALLEDARDDARAAAPDRNVTLSASGAEGAPLPLGRTVEVEADEDQLRRVFSNLLRNAASHTPAGTPIEIALEVGAQRVHARVRDHGPGLPAGDPRAVFERFWRGGSASRGREDGGAGLGLAIVAAVVAAHGGEVEAADASGGGAVFTVTLPLVG